MRSSTLLSLLPLASASTLQKRCQPGLPNPEMQWGHVPWFPCWWQTVSCYSFVPEDAEVLIDEAHNLVVWYGVTEGCLAAIREENDRRADGRPNWGFDAIWGPHQPLDNGALIFTNMPSSRIAGIKQMTRYSSECIYSACPPFTPIQCSLPE